MRANFPGAATSPFPSPSSCTPALGGGPRRGATLLQGQSLECVDCSPPWPDRAHTSTCARTHAHAQDTVQVYASVQGLVEGALGVLSSVPVPLIPCPLVCQLCRKSRSPCPVAAIPFCPVCLEPAPGTTRAPSPGTPLFYRPLGPPRVRFLTEVPLELRWEGGTLSSQNSPHRQGEETVMWWDFLCGHRTSEHLSLSWLACGPTCPIA